MIINSFIYIIILIYFYFIYKKFTLLNYDFNIESKGNNKIKNRYTNVNNKKYIIKINQNKEYKYYNYIKKVIKNIEIYKKEMYKKTKKENIIIDDIIEYIIKDKNIKSTAKILRQKNKINRCLYLYNLYNDKLIYINFRLSNIVYMSKKDWNLWIKQLEEVINKEFIK